MCYLIRTRLCLPCKYPWHGLPVCLHALCMHTCLNDRVRGVVHVESGYINLLFLYRFEAIFNRCFNTAYTIDTEPMWHHVLGLQANFKAPTYEVMSGMLTPMDKEHMASCPKMFLSTLDELSYIYQCFNNTDMQCVIVYEILSCASDRCTERCDGRPKPERDTFGPAMPHVNLGDVGNLERLAWAVYDEMYVPGSWPALSGPHNWARILDKVMTPIFHGKTLWEHCPQAPLEVPMWSLLPT